MNELREKELITAVQLASQRWQTAFNLGHAEDCAACYEEGASMRASPIGDFHGREQIQGFWHGLIGDGFSSVEYIDPIIEIVSEESAILSANWRMNKAHGVIVKELWVLQPDGLALLREDEFANQE